MPDHCHALPFCKHINITSMSRIDACLYFVSSLPYIDPVLLLFIVWTPERQARDRQRFLLSSFRTSPLAARA